MKLTDKPLRFICAQPAIKYYAWQVEVMLNNFRKNGINLNDVDIVCSKPDGVVPEEWSKLANNYAARFFFYDDLRVDKGYISSIRPNILKQHFIKNPQLEKEAILYHDCDIVFTKPIDWIYQYVNGDEYTGQWLHGKKHGKGVYNYSDGDYYDGDWVKD
jgi:hypothetical protein